MKPLPGGDGWDVSEELEALRQHLILLATDKAYCDFGVGVEFYDPKSWRLVDYTTSKGAEVIEHTLTFASTRTLRSSVIMTRQQFGPGVDGFTPWRFDVFLDNAVSEDEPHMAMSGDSFKTYSDSVLRSGWPGAGAERPLSRNDPDWASW